MRLAQLAGGVGELAGRVERHRLVVEPVRRPVELGGKRRGGWA